MTTQRESSDGLRSKRQLVGADLGQDASNVGGVPRGSEERGVTLVYSIMDDLNFQMVAPLSTASDGCCVSCSS